MALNESAAQARTQKEWESPPSSSTELPADSPDRLAEQDQRLEKGASPEPRKPTANPVSTIPDGGLQAWLHVLAGFMLFFNTWGLLNTFGVFQTYYEAGELFQETSSNIAWIGSIQAFMLLFIGFVVGPIYDRGFLRSLLIIGTVLVVLGFMMLSICKTYWQVLLAQGFCVGLGAGCLFVPSVAILPTYFSRKLGLAVGLAAAGSSMGGIIYPIIFYRLVNQIGFGWSVRVLGFICLATLLIPIAIIRMRVKPPKARALVDWTVFTDWPFVFFTIATLIGFQGLYVMLFYISYYGQATGITSSSLSFYLVPILNAGSVFGRTIPNAISDRIGPLNLIIPGAIISGILTLCLIAVHNVGALVAVTLLYGFFSGVFIALPPVCFIVLTKDKSKVGSRIGMGFGVLGVAVLAGGPGGGSILQDYGPGFQWTGLWVYGGLATMIAGIMYIFLRMWKAGGKLMVKV